MTSQPINFDGTDNWGLARLSQSTLPLTGTYFYTVDGSTTDVYLVDSGVRTTHHEITNVVNLYDAYGPTSSTH